MITVPLITAISPLNMATHTAEVNTSITAINSNFAMLPKNSIINGNGIVQQRTAVTISTTAQFGIDRWAAYASGTAISAGTFGQSTSCSIGRTGYGIGITGVTITGSGVIYLYYRMEAKNAARFKNQSATFSGLVYHNVGSAINYTITIYKPASTADIFSSLTEISNQTTSVISETSTKLSFTVSNMGDCGKGLEILISIVCGAITTKNFYFTEMQLTEGTAVSNFEYKLFKQELELCQYYYRKMKVDIYGYSTSDGTLAQVLNYNMRAVPSIVLSGGALSNISSINVAVIWNYGARIDAIVTSTGMASAASYIATLNVEL